MTSIPVIMSRVPSVIPIPSFVYFGQPNREKGKSVKFDNLQNGGLLPTGSIARDTIYSKIYEGVGVNLCTKFGDPRTSGSFLFPHTRPVHDLTNRPEGKKSKIKT